MNTINVDLTLEEFLLVHVNRKYKTHAEAAKKLGFSPAFLSAMLRGKKNISKALLEDAGLSVVKTVTKMVHQDVIRNPIVYGPIGIARPFRGDERKS